MWTMFTMATIITTMAITTTTIMMVTTTTTMAITTTMRRMKVRTTGDRVPCMFTTTPAAPAC